MMLESQKLASDGISPLTLREIYQELYLAKFVEKRGAAVSLAVNQELSDLVREPDGWRVILKQRSSGQTAAMSAEVVILATGYEQCIPNILEGIASLFESEGNRLKLEPDFSARWRTERPARLYLQNAAQHSHGIADPNLSLMAWRSATIINSIFGREHFTVQGGDTLIQWESKSEAARVRESAV
jgi:lysine N6-hydroxylase